jgi:hypothetical protein
MGEVVYRGEVRIERRQPPDREAFLPTGESVMFGAHGAIADHYGFAPGEITQRAATLDYIIAAAGG